MSKKNKTYLITGLILILAFSAGNLVVREEIFGRDISFKLGLDLQGGMHMVYQADLLEIEPANRPEAMEGLRGVIERRIDIFGVKEPLVFIEGEDRLIIELAGVLDFAEAVRIIGETPFLQFKEQRTQEETEKIFAKQEEVREVLGKEPGVIILKEELTEENLQKIQEIENWQMAFKHPHFKPTELTGKHLERSEVGFDHPLPRPIISLQFNEQGAELFKELTARNINRFIAIYIDQVQISVATVQEKITGGRAQITGDFTLEYARERVRSLNAGALPVPITLLSQQSIGPALGEISLNKSLTAGLLGLLAILFFLIFIYRLPGVLAVLSLLIYVLLVLSIFKLIPVTLTLAGIAGFILSIGLAVDANILIFSRIREELRWGKNFSDALETGFERAWPSIRDGNFTTLIIALILFGFGTGFIKGFALTLIIGILISIFSAIFITQNFLRCFVNTKIEKIKSLWY